MRVFFFVEKQSKQGQDKRNSKKGGIALTGPQAALQERVEGLEANLEIAHIEHLEALKERETKHSQQRREWQSQHAALEAQMQALESERDVLNAQVAHLQERHKTGLTKQLGGQAQLEAELMDTKIRLESALEDAQRDLELVRLEQEQQRGEWEQKVQQVREEAVKTETTLRTKIARLESQTGGGGGSDEVAKLREACSAYEQELTTLAEDLQERDDTINDLQGEIESWLSSANQEKEALRIELQAKIDALEARLAKSPKSGGRSSPTKLAKQLEAEKRKREKAEQEGAARAQELQRELEKWMEASTREKDQLQAEIAALKKQKRGSKPSSPSGAGGDVAALQQANAALQAELEKWMESSERERTEAEAKHQKELEVANKKLADLQAELESWMEDSNADKEALQEEINELRERTETAEAEQAETDDQLAEVQHERDALQEQHKESEAQRAKLEREVTKLRSDAKGLHGERQKLARAVQQLKQQLAAAQQAGGSSGAASGSSDGASAADLRVQLDQVRGQLMEEQGEKQLFRAQLEALQREHKRKLEAAEAKSARLEKEVQSWMAASGAEHKRVEVQLQEAMQDLTRDRAAFETEREELAEFREMRAEMEERHQSVLLDLGNQVEKLSQELDSTQKDKDQLAVQLADAVRNSEDRAARLVAAHKSEVEENKTALAMSESRVKELEQELSAQDQILERLQAGIENVATERDQYEKQMQAKLEAAEKRATDAEAEAQREKSQRESATQLAAERAGKIAGLEEELEQVKASLAEANAALEANRTAGDDAKRLAAELAALKLDNESKHMRISTLETELNAATTARDDAKSRLKEVQLRTSSEVDTLQQLIKRLEADVDRGTKEREANDSRVRALESGLEAANAARKFSDEQRAAAEIKLADLQDEFIHLEREKADVEAVKDILHQELEAFRAKIAKRKARSQRRKSLAKLDADERVPTNADRSLIRRGREREADGDKSYPPNSSRTRRRRSISRGAQNRRRSLSREDRHSSRRRLGIESDDEDALVHQPMPVEHVVKRRKSRSEEEDTGGEGEQGENGGSRRETDSKLAQMIENAVVVKDGEPEHEAGETPPKEKKRRSSRKLRKPSVSGSGLRRPKSSGSGLRAPGSSSHSKKKRSPSSKRSKSRRSESKPSKSKRSKSKRSESKSAKSSRRSTSKVRELAKSRASSKRSLLGSDKSGMVRPRSGSSIGKPKSKGRERAATVDGRRPSMRRGLEDSAMALPVVDGEEHAAAVARELDFDEQSPLVELCESEAAVMNQICSWLPASFVFTSLAPISRAMNKWVSTGFEPTELVAPPGASDDWLLHMSKLLRRVEVVSVRVPDASQLTDAGVKALLTWSPSLNEVVLRKAKNVTNRSAAVLRSLKQLRKLTLTGSKVSSDGIVLMTFLPSLVELDFSDTRAIKLRQTLASMEKLQSLRILRLNRCDQKATGEELESLANFGNLEELELAESSSLGDAGLDHISALGETLRVLNLSHCSNITDVGLEYLSGMPLLEHLNMASCGDKITADGVSHLSALVELRYLNVAHCTGVNDAAVADVASCAGHNLEKLNLLGCAQLTDASLAVLGEQCPRLTHLNLNGCELITDEGLAYLHALQQLVVLDLGKCTGITDEGVTALRSLKQLHTIGLSGCSQLSGAASPGGKTKSRMRPLSARKSPRGLPKPKSGLKKPKSSGLRRPGGLAKPRSYNGSS